MPTNRPFLSNFLAAFRAHSAVSHGKATSASSSTHPNPSSSPQPSTAQTTASNPRTITTSTKTGATSAALAGIHSPRNVGSPLSRSPGDAAYEGSPGRSTAGMAVGAGVAGGRYMATTRRGSDSSSEGFRDVLGAEKWYIGGRTAGGDEKYFKLGVVKRQKSGGSLSLDRLSL